MKTASMDFPAALRKVLSEPRPLGSGYDGRMLPAHIKGQIVQSMTEASARTGELRSSLGFGLSCGRQSCLQAAFQAAFSIRDEFLGLRRFHDGGHEAGEKTCCRSNCARLDKLKHVLPRGAEMSLGAADTSVRATSGATANWRERPKPTGELRSPGQAEAYPTKAMRRLHELRVYLKKPRLPLPPPRSARVLVSSLRLRVSAVNR